MYFFVFFRCLALVIPSFVSNDDGKGWLNEEIAADAGQGVRGRSSLDIMTQSPVFELHLLGMVFPLFPTTAHLSMIVLSFGMNEMPLVLIR